MLTSFNRKNLREKRATTQKYCVYTPADYKTYYEYCHKHHSGFVDGIAKWAHRQEISKNVFGKIQKDVQDMKNQIVAMDKSMEEIAGILHVVIEECRESGFLK